MQAQTRGRARHPEPTAVEPSSCKENSLAYKLKKDSLRVKWVHEVYMKGGRWELFNAPITAS